MPFCSQDLAARIEHAEARLVAEACASVALRRPGVFAKPIAGGLAAFTEPGSPLNKVAGLGFAPFDLEAWAQIEAGLAACGAPVQVELSTLADPTIGRHLTSGGYELVGVENVLGRALPARTPEGLPHDLRIEPSPLHEIELWLDTVVTGFACPDVQGVATHEAFDRTVLAQIIRDFAQSASSVRYLARRDGGGFDRRVVGAASMRLDGGIAQLCGAATLPAERRRGVQTALLAHRLGEAAGRGCSIAVVTTQPGSKSQENVQRQGFDLLYSRNVLLRERR